MADKIDYDTAIAEPMIDTIHITHHIPCESIKQFIANKYPHFTILFEHVKFLHSGQAIAQALLSHKAIVAMNASVSQLTQRTTVSWIITDRTLNMCGEGLSG